MKRNSHLHISSCVLNSLASCILAYLHDNNYDAADLLWGTEKHFLFLDKDAPVHITTCRKWNCCQLGSVCDILWNEAAILQNFFNNLCTNITVFIILCLVTICKFLLYHHSHHRDNVTAPHGRPNLRSRLHFCHAQEGRPRSLSRTCGALGKRKKKVNSLK